MIFGLIAVALGMFVGLNLLGIALSYAVIPRVSTAHKIQDRRTAFRTLNERLPLVGLNVLIICVLTGVSVYLCREWFVFDRPVWWVLLLQVAFVAASDDFFFYVIHRLLHRNPTLYRVIHKIHHRAYAPVPLDYLYVHPLEWILGLTGIVVAFVSLALIGGGLNVWTFVIYSVLRQVHELHIHSGIRSGVGRFLPLWGTSEHHDLHHAKPTLGNYAATFTLWDVVFGTRIG